MGAPGPHVGVRGADPFGRGSHGFEPRVRRRDIGLLGGELRVDTVGQIAPLDRRNEISGWVSLVGRLRSPSAGRTSGRRPTARVLGSGRCRAALALHARRRRQPAARVGAAGGHDRHAARPAGPDGVGLQRARAVEGAPRRRSARRGRDRGDGPGRARSRSSATSRRCTAIRGRWPSGPTPCACTSSSTTAAGPTGSGTACRRATSCSRGSSRCPGSVRPRPGSSSACSGKRLGVQPPGWEVVAADWPSIADVDTFERVGEIREGKRAMKAAAKAEAAAASAAVPTKGPASPARKARAKSRP